VLVLFFAVLSSLIPMASPGLEFVSSGQKGFLLFFTASLSVPPVLVIAALDFFSIRTPPRSVVLSLAPSRRSRSDRVFRFKILFYGSSRPKRVHFPAAGFGLRVKYSATGRSCSHSGFLSSPRSFLPLGIFSNCAKGSGPPILFLGPCARYSVRCTTRCPQLIFSPTPFSLLLVEFLGPPDLGPLFVLVFSQVSAPGAVFFVSTRVQFPMFWPQSICRCRSCY
jgi:hypothetical protein